MQGRKCLARLLITLSLAASGCSPNMLMKPDCHSCTVEEQEWKQFSWNDLLGKWKGSVENVRNIQGANKIPKTDKLAEFHFMTADAFLQARGGAACRSLPTNALVMNGQFWENGSTEKEYEAFVPVEDGKVAYGRVSFDKVNGKELCQFRRFGRVMGKNRLDLPSVNFSDRAVTGIRQPASLTAEQDISVEFLRFAPGKAHTKAFQADGRRPSSVQERERPPFIFRVFKVTSKINENRGEWSGTEEYIYRLWKTQ